MTQQRKILILIPPFLIGISLLLVFFTIEHRQQLQTETPSDQIATTTSDTNDTMTPPSATQPDGPDAPISSNDPVFCTMDAKLCPDGSSVGRVGPNCEFAACPGEVPEPDSAFIECPAGSRAVDACIEIYQPVCAAVEVQCVTTPCEPQPKTFGNSCFACMDENVIGYHEGACVADAI